MSVTILEALQNGDHNLNSQMFVSTMFAKEQIHNVVILLEKGYDINEEVEPLLDKYGKVENVPDKESN